MNRIGLILAFAIVAIAAYALGTAHDEANVKADTPPAQVDRYRIVQLHQSTDASWSGLLDTRTGCVWAYASDSNKNMVWDLVPGGPCTITTAPAAN